MQTAQAAQAEGNFKLVLQAIAQGTRLIKIILKQDFPLDSRLVYEILASDQWATQTGLLPHDPKLMALSRQSLTGTLAAPCPENEPESAAAISPEDLDRLQENLLSLAQAAGQPKNDNRLSQKREKGGKLPGNSLSFDRIYEEYQRILEEEKITGKDKARVAQGR